MTNDLSSAAAALGRRGGQSRSEAKIAAARENGRKGGRPTMQKYNIEIDGDIAYTDLTQEEANYIAAREAKNHTVFVKWFRRRDSQHGYLNSDGNHAITGKAW